MNIKIKTFEEYLISDSLKYHLDNGLTITETIHRVGSDSYYNLVNEVRSLYNDGRIELTEDDKIIVERLKTGVRAVTRDGKSVTLDSPSYSKNKKKKFVVYRDSGKKNKDGKIIAKKIEFGDPNLKIKNSDPEASKSFRARHKCDQKKDKDTAGWWSCNIHLFAKQLGLSSTSKW